MWAPVEGATRDFELRRRNTVVGGKCALPSALLDVAMFQKYSEQFPFATLGIRHKPDNQIHGVKTR